jgi:hypothetical protein
MDFRRYGPTSRHRSLFDNLIGAAEQQQRHRDAERLGGHLIDEQFDFRDLLDWQARGPFPLRIRPA